MNGEEWKVRKNLHEIILSIPDFIESTKQLEDQCFEQHEIREAKNLINNTNNNDPILTQAFGNYILEGVYDLSQFKITQRESDGEVVYGKYNKTCSVYHCMEQDDSGS